MHINNYYDVHTGSDALILAPVRPGTKGGREGGGERERLLSECDGVLTDPLDSLNESVSYNQVVVNTERERVKLTQCIINWFTFSANVNIFL